MNRQLKAEYIRVDTAQYSLYRVFSGEEKLKVQELANFQQETETMYRLEEKYLDLRTAVRNQWMKLELLGVNPFPLSRDEQLFMDSTLFRSSVALTVKRISKPLMIMLPMSDIRDIDRFSMKVQNEKLPKIIELKRNEIERLTVDIRKLREFRADLKQAKTDYIEMRAFYQRMTPDLSAIKSKLDARLNEEKERYAKNGPRGFLDNYHNIFPEVFLTE